MEQSNLIQLNKLIEEGSELLNTAYEKDIGISVISGSHRRGRITKTHNPRIVTYVNNDEFNEWFEKCKIFLNHLNYGDSISKTDGLGTNYDFTKEQLAKLKAIYELNNNKNSEGMDMFNKMPKTKFKVTKSTGETFDMNAVEATKGKMIAVEHKTIKPNIIEENDIIEAQYSNGTTKKFIVLDPGFYEAYRSMPMHYQIKIESCSNSNASSDEAIPTIHNTGNLVINNNSPNATLNISQDLKVFDELSEKIKEENTIENKQELLELVEMMKNNVNNKQEFAQNYGQFMQVAAAHMAVLSPFLQPLAALLGG